MAPGIFALSALALGLPGCTRVQPASVEERCSEDQPCARGLKCSFGKKRCFRPVDCDALATRLQACTRELVETYSPESKKLPAKTLAKLLPRIQEHLRSQVVAHCRYDAADQKRKTGAKPSKKKSWGEDREAEALNGCVAKRSCSELATCLLGLAGLTGDRAKDPEHKAVFPLELPGQGAPEDGGDAQDPTMEAAAMGPPEREPARTDAPEREAARMGAPEREAARMNAPEREAARMGAPEREAARMNATPSERPKE